MRVSRTRIAANLRTGAVWETALSAAPPVNWPEPYSATTTGRLAERPVATSRTWAT